MAQSSAFLTYDAVGNREDLSDVIFNISPEETPFLSKFGKTKAKNRNHEWLTDALAAPATNAHIEGSDYSFVKKTPRTRLGNYTQIFITDVEVSDTQRAVETAGLEDEFAYQMAKSMKEHARDIEIELVTGTGNSGASGTARKLKGVLPWITTTVITGTGTGSEALTEGMFNDALQSIWNEGGTPRSAYVNGFQKRKVSAFTGNNTRNVGASEKEVISGVDVLTKLVHVKLGYMLEHPKAINAQGSCEATLIMVQSVRKFNGYYGQSAGKISRMVCRNNRWRRDDRSSDVQIARWEDTNNPLHRDFKYSQGNFGRMYADIESGNENISSTSSKTYGQKEFQCDITFTRMADTGRWTQVCKKHLISNSSLSCYEERQSSNSSEVYRTEGRKLTSKKQARKNNTQTILSRGSKSCITNKSPQGKTRKILRDYTPGPEHNSGDDIVRSEWEHSANINDSSDFGVIKVYLHRYMTASVVAILTDDLWKTSVLRPTHKVDVAKVGSATRAVVETELTLEARNEAGSGQITGLTTS